MKLKLHRDFPFLTFAINLFVTLLAVYLIMAVKALFIYNGTGLHYNLFWLPLVPASFTLASFYHWDYVKQNKKYDHPKAHMFSILLLAAAVVLYFTLPEIAYMPAYNLFASV